MTSGYTYRYSRSGEWMPYEIPELDSRPDTYTEHEWWRFLRDVGFEDVSSFGTEYTLFSAVVYAHKTHGYVINLNTDNGREIAWIACEDAISYMHFMREYSSLFATAMARDVVELVAEINKTLFDPQLGLPAVRRVNVRNGREASIRRAQKAAG